MKLLLRYFYTIKYLKIKQIRFQLYYRLRAKVLILFHIKQTLSITKEGYPVKLIPWIEKANTFNDFSFTFLNLNRSFNPTEIDWDYDEYGKLWTLNLNYFDFLLQPKVSSDTGEFLITDFINKLNQRTIALDSYTISLRGINWIKFFSKFKVQSSKFDNSLFAQYKILYNTLEYHLLGNHLLENAFSLLFGAFYFRDMRFYNKAKQILKIQLKEQILLDGAHFELSPMYHQTILDRLLDCINLLKNNHQFENQDNLFHLMQGKVEKMIFWLNSMTFSKGDFPLLNDSTVNIAPTTNQLLEYTKRLNLKPVTYNLKLSDSGYRRYNGDNYECIIDVGQIGPDYIPGHAHADTFNFVLNINSKPFIVDTGISTYEKNKQRSVERSTSAHNTVLIDNKNSSDVWGGFRVSKRAKVKILTENNSNITAVHNGYNTIKITHLRKWKFKTDSIIITDELSCYEKRGLAFLHFAPEFIPHKMNNAIITDYAKIEFSNAKSIILKEENIPVSYNTFKKHYIIITEFESMLKTVITIL